MKRQTKFKNVILGGGITGLIALQHKDDSVLYESGNRVASDFFNDLFPKYIHCNKRTEGLFNKLKVKVDKEEFAIKIFYKGEQHDFFDNELTDKEKKIIYLDYCLKKYGKLKENKMNGFLTGNHERFYIKNKKDFIGKLYKCNRKRIFLKHKAMNINTDTHEITFERRKVITYDNLISTIPIDVFSLIASKPINVDEIKANLICCIVKGGKHLFLKNDFCYVPDFNYTFHRINIDRNKKILTFEFCDDLGCSFDLFAFLGGMKIAIKKTFERVFTFPVVNEPVKINGVKFLGRFSTGDYETKIEDVIREVENEK